MLLVSLVLGGALAVAGRAVDGRSFGGFVLHRIVCAMRGGCDDGHPALAEAYGADDAELLRRHAPDIVYEPGERQLPVDYRECREAACANAPDDRDLDAHRTRAGRRATVYTRVVRRNGRTYLQYWLYYPDSNSTFAGSDKLWRRSVLAQLAGRALRGSSRYPGFHLDDWEAYQVRIDRRGGVAVRASSHGHYQWCKQRRCRNRWGPPTGWTRVSRGSHAGHIPLGRRADGIRGARGLGDRARLPGRDMRERTSTAEGLRLVPLESIDRRRYRRLAKGVSPPWYKRVYRDPEDRGS